MRYLHVALLLPLLSHAARADDVRVDPDDRSNKVTRIDAGVWELDLGAVGVLAHDSDAGMSVTRASADGAIQLNYFVMNNVSVGAEVLVQYDTIGGGNNSVTFGGALDATAHLRLGHGLFWRTGIALGGLAGHRNSAVSPGMVTQASESAFLARISFPLEYFTTHRFLIEAGPQLNFETGSYTPTSAGSVSFTRVTGGFAVGAGYMF